MTLSGDAAAFDRHLDATAPGVADIARALRLTVLEVPWRRRVVRPSDGLLAFGTGGSMRDFYFAIIPHKACVNLQLADGADLPNPDGRIEGTGKRIRHSRSAPSRMRRRPGSVDDRRPGRPPPRLTGAGRVSHSDDIASDSGGPDR